MSSPTNSKDVVISLSDVSVRFTLPTERVATFKERAIQLLRGSNTASQEYWALNGVNLAVKRGETIGLVGRNGAGKSTLLKVIARIYTPTTGHLMVRGRVAPLIELGTGFHPELTGRENIYLNGAMLGLTHEEMDAKIDRIIEFAELGPFIDSPVRTYSSGMVVRLGFSIATDVEPDILIIDEVLTVGDYGFQEKSRARMNSFTNSGTTILFVSHNERDMRAMCDTGVWIDRGRVRRYGPINDVINEYKDSLLDRPRLFEGTTLPEKQAGAQQRHPHAFADLPDALHANLIWMVQWIDHTHQQGITFGAASNQQVFRPTQPITYGEAVTMLMRAHKAKALPLEARRPKEFVTSEIGVSMMRASEMGLLPTDAPPPDKLITRAQAAVLILKVLHGATYTPPPAEGIFDDLDTQLATDEHWMIPWIEQIYRQHITTGCKTGFCPNEVVDRGTFAVFVGRAFQQYFGKPNQ